MVFLVHHAEAVDASLDPQRPLTPEGAAHAQRLAQEAAARGVKPAVIWHSGKLRARHTADAFWRACNPLSEFGAVRGLQPADPPAWIRDRLLGEVRDVMLIGHLPNIARIGELIADVRTFPAHCLVAIDWDGEKGREAWRLL
jgi:phosphohistidine phosphatase